MKHARRQLLRSSLAPVAWASLLLLASTQALLLPGTTQASPGALALAAPGQKIAPPSQHGHCDTLGSGLRPALEPAKSCAPRLYEKLPPHKRRELEAKPVTNEPIYASATALSPRSA